MILKNYCKIQKDCNVMVKQIFVNLAIKDLKKSNEFFKKLGFSFDPQFSDEKATCLIISENIFAMLLVDEYFKTFIKKEVCDVTKSAEAILALSAESRQEVDDMMKKVIAAGGSEPGEPEDHGWMHGRSFQDLDGHLWEIFYMDKSAIEQA